MRGHATSLLLLLLAVASLAHAEAAEPLQLRSPAGTASASLTLDEAGQPRLSVSWRDEPVLLPSPLGAQFADDRLERDLRITGTRTREHDARYRFVAGKAREGRDHYRELEVDLADAQGRTLGLVLRAYDDGIAFRYRLPLPAQGDLLVGSTISRSVRSWIRIAR